MNANADEKERAKDQARATLASIVEMVQAFRDAAKAEDWDAYDEAREAIENDPLSVEVRSDWHTPGADEDGPTEYRILLSWGGPAAQITGELDKGQPTSAKLQYQDWFTAWTDYRETSEEEDAALLDYAQVFYFGE